MWETFRLQQKVKHAGPGCTAPGRVMCCLQAGTSERQSLGAWHLTWCPVQILSKLSKPACWKPWPGAPDVLLPSARASIQLITCR
jgi:hypothetical protein